MRTFSCQCGNRLYFENVQCLACGRDVGWCESCSEISSFAALDEIQFACDKCGQIAEKCHNYSVEQVCNRFRPTNSDSTGELCSACELTDTIPDLSVEENREKWRRLEQAKRRLLFQLDMLKLPYRNVEPPLRFDFKGHVVPDECVYRKGEPAEHVYTGHADGKITINIQEADDVEREKLRVDMNESQRTLIGHFRHEVGHYYWQLLVQNRCEDDYIAIFGDHREPDYATAMSNYYQQGPRPDWNEGFISAYASSHPWEDFAETFALYLDIRSVLDTVHHLGIGLPKVENEQDVGEYILAFQKLGLIVNEINRCLGIFDLVPEVIPLPVCKKLNFIHKLLSTPEASLKTELPSGVT